MKKHILFLLCLIAVASTRAQVFADHFADKTLRVDYIFNGNASGQGVGARQARPRHIPAFICFLQAGRRKLAVGPPTSWI